LIGVQCVRRAVDVAREIGAEVLRSEANPDLAATRQLLGQLGFEQVGPVEEEGGVRRVALQKSLRAGG
jgi:L-amino acid N-acyltransferase YncA